MRTLKTIIVALALFALPASVAAHGAIFTYKYIDGDNLVMVTHNVHDAQAGMAITYNLRLYTMGGQLVPFEQAQAHVVLNGTTVAEKTVQMQNDEANFVYTYPEEGNYILRFVFLDQSKQVAAGEFPIAVAPDYGTNLLVESIKMIGAFLLGAGALKLYQERRNLPRHLQALRKKLTR